MVMDFSGECRNLIQDRVDATGGSGFQLLGILAVHSLYRVVLVLKACLTCRSSFDFFGL